MRSAKTKKFDALFQKLPPEIQKAARKAFTLWLENPNHPSLRFKCVSPEDDLWSIRITRGYRALAKKKGELFLWIWIGNHDDYESFLDSFHAAAALMTPGRASLPPAYFSAPARPPRYSLLLIEKLSEVKLSLAS